MGFTTEETVGLLIKGISELNEVQSIGISGDISPFPKAGEGDIDVFIYCHRIPDAKERQAILDQLDYILQESKVNLFHGGHFGLGDFTLINGVETWLMYFTVEENRDKVEAILKGEYPDKLDNYYYPTGRLAMFKNMSIMYDKNGYLASLKKRLEEYPESLARVLTRYHLEELEDVEDLERAAARGDVLFYHFALDLALDHFLQALFAINRTYFPSRKRTVDLIRNFNIKPENCEERLLEIIRLGTSSENIVHSYELLRSMASELKKLDKVNI